MNTCLYNATYRQSAKQFGFTFRPNILLDPIWIQTDLKSTFSNECKISIDTQFFNQPVMTTSGVLTGAVIAG